MADKPIVRIENNDTDMRFKQKCNANFQMLSRGLQFDGTISNIINQVVDQGNPVPMTEVFNMVYPIGAGIWTNSPNDPRLSRGVWQQVKDVFLYAAGDKHANGSTGGSETVALVKNQMPVHAHDAEASTPTASQHTHAVDSGGAHTHTAGTGLAGDHAHTASSASAGDHSHYENARNDLAEGSSGDGKHAAIGSAGGWIDNFYSTKSAGTHTHTITINTAGSHSHAVTVQTANSDHTHTLQNASITISKPSITVASEGLGQPHENMPPFLGRYYFERIL